MPTPADTLTLVAELPDGRVERRIPPDGGPVTLGRAADCGLVLPHAGVSRRHAEIVRDGDGWEVRDLGSRNSTRVDGAVVSRRRLADGDELRLGPARVVVRLGMPGSAVAAAATPVDPGRAVSWSGGVGGRADDPAISLSYSVAGLLPEDEPDPGSGTEGADADHRRAVVDRLSGIRLFRGIGEALARGGDLDAVLQSVLDVVVGSLPCQRAAICLLDSAGTPVPRAVHGARPGDPLPISRTVAAAAVEGRRAMLIEGADSVSDIVSLCAAGVRSAVCVPLERDGEAEGFLYADTCDPGRPLTADDLAFAAAAGLFGGIAVGQARLRERLDAERRARDRLSRYSSPAVVDRILAADADRMLADAAEVTALFADLRGFTAMSEGRPPAEVVDRLNAVFTGFADCVFAEDGTLDKFMGDGLLAFFGAPLPQPDHAARAVRAAVAMRRRLAECEAGPEPLAVRIGINSGPAVVGDVGSPGRRDYTVIGDAVNVASRLESSVAKPGQIVVGPRTAELLAGGFDLAPLPPVVLKGKSVAVVPWLVAAE